MQMTEAEIKRRYNDAPTTNAKKKQIRIMSELNACSQQEIREILGVPEPKQRKKTKVPEAVLEAVRTRVQELENYVAGLKEAMARQQEHFDRMMDEWAALKEWQQEYDHQAE